MSGRASGRDNADGRRDRARRSTGRLDDRPNDGRDRGSDGAVDRWPPPYGVRGAGLETIDYEPIANEVVNEENRARMAFGDGGRKHFYGYTGLTFSKYVLTLVAGVGTGAIAYGIACAVNHVYALKRWLIEDHLSRGGTEALHAYAYYTSACLGLVLVASSICVFWAPQAAGGGVTLVIAYLNGTHVPNLLGWKSLVAKTLGVVCACGSSLAVGPEGPMVHIGAALASCITLALPRTCLGEVRGGEEDGDGEVEANWRTAKAEDEMERRAGLGDGGYVTSGDVRTRREERGSRRTGANGEGGDDGGGEYDGLDVDGHVAHAWQHRTKVATRRAAASSRLLLDLASHATQREFVSAGAAAGLAAAFGAPIGGVLFSLEEASSFWSRKVMWRSFICAASASIVLALLNNRGNVGMLFFGGVRPTTPRDYLHQLPLFIATAAAAGVAGVVFNQLQAWLAAIRPKSKHKVRRLIESSFVVLGTVALRFYASRSLGTCVPQPEAWAADDFGVRFLCEEGEVNDVATTLFSSPDKTISWMLSMGELSWGKPYGFTPRGLGLCSGLYLVMMIAAFGTAVPGGIFMPSIFLGACGGGCLGLLFRKALPNTWDIQPGLYALIGATAMLGGVFRSSISLVVIMVEGTGGISFVFCIIVAVVVSNAVGSWFTHHGVYHLDLERNEAVSFLSGEPPRKLALLIAGDLMAAPCECVGLHESASRVRGLLSRTTHNGFPVVDDQGRLVGLILRSQLSVLLHGEEHAAPGSMPWTRRVLDTYMRVVHLRNQPMPQPLLPPSVRPVLSDAALAEHRRIATDVDTTVGADVALFGGAWSRLPRRWSDLPRRWSRLSSDGQPSEDGDGTLSRVPSKASGGFGSEIHIGSPDYDGALAGCDARESTAEEAGVRPPVSETGYTSTRVYAGEVRRDPGAVPRVDGSDERATSRPVVRFSFGVRQSQRGGSFNGLGIEDGSEGGGDECGHVLDVASFMHQAPLAVQMGFPATRVHVMFCTLKLRHLVVTDATNRAVGIITRKDVMRALGN